MQKHKQYWLINLTCVAVLTVLYIVQKGGLYGSQSNGVKPQALYGQVATTSAFCTEMSGYWKLDSGDGVIAIDSSSYGNDADFVNIDSTAWQTDTPEEITFWNPNAIELPGTGYLRVQTGTNLKLTGDVTVSLWAKYSVLNSAETSNVLVSYAGPRVETTSEIDDDNYVYSFSMNGASKKLRMMWENGTSASDVIVESTSAASVNANEWSHVLVTRNASQKTVSFYVNGSLLGTTENYSLVPSGNSGAASLYIGVGPHNPSGTYFNGLIDDVRIYSKALSAAEVSTLYNGNDTLLGCTCGNNEIEPPEECDDGNTDSTDSCTIACKNPICGDGYVQTSLGEECEPANTATCSASCKNIVETASSSSSPRVVPPNCGNRIVNASEGEECDEGHLNGKGECSEYCTILYCGDGILSPVIDEECEPTPSSYVNGEPIFTQATCGDSCAIPVKDSKTNKVIGGCTRLFLSPCETESVEQPASSVSSISELKPAAGIQPTCGDTVVDTNEECDDGNTLSDDGCSNECTVEYCGDGVVQTSTEQCDNGQICNNDNTVQCSTNEDCTDNGTCVYNYDADTNCTNECTTIVARSSSSSAAAFTNVTTASATSTPSAECGNFLLEAGEQCDDGILNSNTLPDACREDCTEATCGDGVIDTIEQCDGGDKNSDTTPDACRTSCRLPMCGDGVRDTGEQCDGGPTCKKDCTLPSLSVCGNGIVEGNEKCDDGNIWPGDGCSSLCAIETAASSTASSSASIPVPSSSNSVAGMQNIVEIQSSSQQSSTTIIPVAVASSSSFSMFTLQPIQNIEQRPIASVIQNSNHSPVGDTGPGGIIVVSTGAAVGYLWRRRKKA